MNSLCLFASYYKEKEIPEYIRVYLKELRVHFTKVVFLTCKTELSDSDLSFLKNGSIEHTLVQNEGFDFGMWYKALKTVRTEDLDQLALVNDSCVLFAPLTKFMNWAHSSPAQAIGMTLSEAVSKHLQSYFLLFKKQAIPLVAEYFEQNGLLNNLSDVIRKYEIGLSTYLISKGIEPASFVDNKAYRGEFSPYYHCVDHHLEQGLPLIKKKILFSSYRKDELFTLARMNFRISPHYYAQKIKLLHPHLIIDLEHLLHVQANEMNFFNQLKYHLQRLGIQVYRKLKSR